MYINGISTKGRKYIVRSSSFFVQFVIFKTRLLSAVDVITYLQ